MVQSTETGVPVQTRMTVRRKNGRTTWWADSVTAGGLTGYFILQDAARDANIMHRDHGLIFDIVVRHETDENFTWPAYTLCPRSVSKFWDNI